MRHFPVLAALTIALPFQAPAPAAAADVDCKKDLRKAVELIENRWSFKLFKPGTVDFRAAYAELEGAADRAETPEACADVLARFMAKLHDGHSSLQYFPGLEYTAPEIEIRSQRERLSRTPGVLPSVHAYVVDRDTTDAALRELRPGSEILAVDGVPVDTLYARLLSRVSGSTQQWKDYIIDRGLLLGPADTEVELRIRTPGGTRETLVVVRPPYPSDDEMEAERKAYRDTAQIATAARLEGGWGYIRYTTFAFGDVRETVGPFDGAVNALMDAPGLILDLRGNGGGYVGAMVAAAGRFIDDRIVLQYLQVREPGQELVLEYYDPTTMSPTTKPPVLADRRGDVYTGPVVVLIDRGCFSACEGFTGGLQSVNRVLVVGSEASGGGSGWVSGLELPSGAIISFSWTVGWRPDGGQIESQGVRPDIRVRERARDYATGRDRVLERAVRALEEGEARTLAVMTTDG